MALPFIDFTRIPINKPDYSEETNLPLSLLEAYERPYKMEEAKKKQDLENAFKREQGRGKGIENDILALYGNDEAAAKNALLKAQAQYYRGEGLSDLGGLFRERNGLPIGSVDRELYDTALQNEAQGPSRTSDPYKGKPAVTKHQMMQEEIDAGFMPGSNYQKPIESREQQELLSNQNQLAIQKLTTDKSVRDRALEASNIQKTMHAANVDDLVAYSGPKGQLELKKDQGLDLIGEAPEKYKKYKKAVTLEQLAVKEIRQFYKDSITPTIQEKLDKMTNPTGWGTSPEVAKIQYNELKRTIDKQLSTIQEGLLSTKPYRRTEQEAYELGESGRPKNNERIKRNVMSGKESGLTGGSSEPSNQHYVTGYKNGKAYKIPEDEAGEFIESGGRING